jgi:hypothetical protein
MALSKTTKIVLVVGGIILIAGVGAYIYMNRPKPKKQEENTDEVLADVFDNLNFEFGKSDIKKDSLPELINEANAELQSMGSNDLIYITVYKDFLTFQILRGELNKPKNKK